MIKKMLCCVMVGIIIFLCGCTEENIKSENERLAVYTSIYPLYDFARAIGGDKAEVNNIVPAGAEPHDWEPTVNDMVNLENCDVFIYNGAGMEHWIEKVTGVIENKIIIVEASQGCKIIETDEGVDPHIWLSITNAKKEAENIKNAFISADEKNKEYYEQNFISLTEKFDELDKSYKEEIGKTKNKNIIVSHAAFGYLCDEYGLTQKAIEGLNAEAEPEPAKMAKIAEFAKENDIKVIFFEELAGNKLAEVIAEETDAQCLSLNPLEGLTDEQATNGEDYFSIMRSNLENLKTALN